MTVFDRLKPRGRVPLPVVALLAIWGLGCLSVVPRFPGHPVYAGLSFILSALVFVFLCLRHRWAFWVVLLFNMFVFQAAAGFATQRGFFEGPGGAWEAGRMLLPLICIALCFCNSSLVWFTFSSPRRVRWTGMIVFAVMALPSFCVGARSGWPPWPNHSIQRNGASRSAQSAFLAQWQLAPAADPDRSAA